MGIWYNPPPPFIGGLQPHEPKRMGAQLFTAPPVPDSPPLVRITPQQLEEILLWWIPPDPLPTLSVKNAALIPVVVVTAFPFGQLDSITASLIGWIDTSYPPTQRKTVIVPASLDTPLPNANFFDNYEIVIQAWQPPDPLPVQRRLLIPTTAPGIISVPITNHIALDTILRLWQPPDPQPVFQYKQFVASTDNPPLTTRTIISELVNRLWIPPDPTRMQYPIYVGSVDNPPLLNRILPNVLDSWQPVAPYPTQFGKFLFAPPVVNAPPLTTVNALLSILAQWNPVDPLIVQYPKFTFPGAVVSAPPLTSLATFLSIIAQHWKPVDPQLIQYAKYVASVDPPPLTTLVNLNSIIRGWQPVDSQLIQYIRFVFPAPVVSAPPLTNLVNFFDILGQWQPVNPPLIKYPILVYPGVPAQAPPLTTLVNLLNIIEQWAPAYVAQQIPVVFPQVAPRNLHKLLFIDDDIILRITQDIQTYLRKNS